MNPDRPPSPGPATNPTDGAPPARRGLLTLGVAAAAALAGGGLAWWRQATPPAADSASAAPTTSDGLAALWALRVDRPEGGELVLADLRGQPLLINFWATWCAPCVREMPELDRFHRSFGPKGWQVVGLAIDGPTPVREFLGRVKVGFAIGLAGLDGTELVRQLGNAQGGLPFTVMISADGRVLQRKMGETHFDELAGWAARA
ncbi:MAG: redoxin [Burkholderiales bacterium RIFCSPHIGHO2_12_FULL_69_20]|nr:MAG: redoxin [Burkholderiales bacterium RIFCSPHIGHO2_12_FULL_69_20]